MRDLLAVETGDGEPWARRTRRLPLQVRLATCLARKKKGKLPERFLAMFERIYDRNLEEAKRCRASLEPFGPARDGNPGRQKRRSGLNPAEDMPIGRTIGRTSSSAWRTICRSRREQPGRAGHQDVQLAAEYLQPLPNPEGRDDSPAVALDRESRPLAGMERHRHPGRFARKVHRGARRVRELPEGRGRGCRGVRLRRQEGQSRQAVLKIAAIIHAFGQNMRLRDLSSYGVALFLRHARIPHSDASLICGSVAISPQSAKNIRYLLNLA